LDPNQGICSRQQLEEQSMEPKDKNIGRLSGIYQQGAKGVQLLKPSKTRVK